MTGLSAWRRRAGGALAALVLAVFAFAPAADAMICADGSTAVAVSMDGPDGASADADQPDVGGCEDGCGPCVHCSCHHAGAYLPVAMTAAVGPSASRARHALSQARAPTSDLSFGFKRPPRA